MEFYFLDALETFEVQSALAQNIEWLIPACEFGLDL